ncbi:MAG: hypothetical protein U0Y10_19780 [Spirosomataceae bacterium]
MLNAIFATPILSKSHVFIACATKQGDGVVSGDTNYGGAETR